MCQSIVLGIILSGILSSLNDEKSKVKEGCYFSTHGHVSTLFKIEGDKVEWYRDNEMKVWGCGRYTLSESDSIIKITYDEIWESKHPNQKVEFAYALKVKWNEMEGMFELSDYVHRQKSEAIKELMKRVKSSCKFKAIKLTFYKLPQANAVLYAGVSGGHPCGIIPRTRIVI